jgi:3-isopropylmalate/(R)-2-methylmalate dehydratase small subunit
MIRFENFSSTAIILNRENVDTDQIIPARFLTVTDKAGLGRHLFADWRSVPECPLNQDSAFRRQILIAGHNFGCGSSREHAVWALQDFGFRAVVSTGFADIFRQNALKNGLLPIVLEPAEFTALRQALLKDPDAECRVDLAAQKLSGPAGLAFAFPIDSFSRLCLLEGTDELGYLLAHSDAIARYEGRNRH